MPTDPNPTALAEQVGGNHYQSPLQHAEFCEANRIPWCLSCALKYVVRHRKKNGRQDLEKAEHYLRICKEMWGRHGVPEKGPRMFTGQHFCELNDITDREAIIVVLLSSAVAHGGGAALATVEKARLELLELMAEAYPS